VKNLSSASAELAWRIQQQLFPVATRRALFDNRPEFGDRFRQAPKASCVTHWHTYPRTPKMNAHCERFNRTLQEECVDYQEQLLFDDLHAFQRSSVRFARVVQPPNAPITLSPYAPPIDVISNFVHQPWGCTGLIHSRDRERCPE
jgi:transposase InsO family protein